MRQLKPHLALKAMEKEEATKKAKKVTILHISIQFNSAVIGFVFVENGAIFSVHLTEPKKTDHVC